MSVNKIFLVGATGGLGGHVLKGLIEQSGVEVITYVRTPSKLNDLDHYL